MQLERQFERENGKGTCLLSADVALPPSLLMTTDGPQAVNRQVVCAVSISRSSRRKTSKAGLVLLPTAPTPGLRTAMAVQLRRRATATRAPDSIGEVQLLRRPAAPRAPGSSWLGGGSSHAGIDAVGSLKRRATLASRPSSRTVRKLQTDN